MTEIQIVALASAAFVLYTSAFAGGSLLAFGIHTANRLFK